MLVGDGRRRGDHLELHDVVSQKLFSLVLTAEAKPRYHLAAVMAGG